MEPAPPVHYRLHARPTEASSNLVRQSLTRYDTVSLRPISNGGTEPPRFSTATFPRFGEHLSEGWTHYAQEQQQQPHPFAADEQFQPQGGVPHNRPIHQQQMDSWHHRLQRNHHISIHRIAFIFLKFPALIAGVIAALLLFGQRQKGHNFGESSNSSNIWSLMEQNEYRAGIAGMGTSVLILTSLLLLGQQSHWHSHQRASLQAYWRVFFSLFGLCLSIATGTFSALALDQVRFETVQMEPGPLDHQHRIVYFAILIGLCVLKFILSAIAIIHGIQAIVRIRKDRTQMAQMPAGGYMSNGHHANRISVFNGTEMIGAFNTNTDTYTY